MISRVVWGPCGPSPVEQRWCQALQSSERSGPDPEGFLLDLWWWLFWFFFVFRLLSFQCTEAAGQEQGFQQSRGTFRGGIGVPGDCASPSGGSPSKCGGGKGWGGDIVCLLHPVTEVGSSWWWLSAVDGGYHFLIVCNVWRLLGGSRRGEMAFYPRPTLLWHPAGGVPSPGELPCAGGVVVGFSLRWPASWGNASVGLGLGAGEDQHLPRGARSPLSGTSKDGFLTRTKGIGFLIRYKWPNILPHHL